MKQTIVDIYRSQAKHFLLLIVGVLLFSATPASAQICAAPGKDGAAGTITGVVNTYYPGTANAAAAATTITLGTATGASTAITANDLLIVIQMQDASINSSNNTRYGDGVNQGPASGYTNANGVGRYEFVRATNSVPLAGGTLNLQGAGTGNGLINAYTNANATGSQGQRRFQVVRVPQYLSATLGAGLTALKWNGSTGGVLSVDVARIFTMASGTATVTGLGFRGGAGLRLTGSGGSNNDVVAASPTSSSTLTGFDGSKGEGIAGTPRFVWDAATSTVVDTGTDGYPNGSMARGAPGNAGGGGTDGDPNGANDENSGGGGGGNGGAGGLGGNSWSSNLAVGGYGGVAFAERAAGRLVMGGGGGAGTRNNDTDVLSSDGSAGGGIIIIRAGTISGTGVISADGAAANNSTTRDGGGGAGAGGSVVVWVANGTLTGLIVSANGGRGGDAWRTQAPGGTPGERHGPGGGGGGGVIFLASAALASSVTGGTNGLTTTANDSFGATAGGAGPAVVTNLTAASIPGVQAGVSCPLSTTDVTLVSFNARVSGKSIALDWKTGYEVGNLGFNIYRQKNGNYSRINPEPVAGSALLFGPTVALRAGFSYSFLDNDGDSNNSMYWLEDIDLSGKTTMHGPYFVSKSIDRLPVSGKGTSPLLGAVASASEKLAPEIATVPVVPKAKILKPTPGALAAQASIASKPAVKLSVKRNGWYRVSQTDLLAAGFPATADPLSIQLFVDSQEVPIIVTSPSSKSQKPTTSAWDGVEFYGVGIDSPYTDSHVYWLVAGNQPGLRIPQAQSNPSPSDPFSFSYSVERRDKLVYFSALKNGGAEKFFGSVIFNAQPASQSLDIHNVASSGSDATLEVSIQGFTTSEHNVSVSFNGSAIGSLQFSGQTKGVSQFSIPLASIVDGTNTVQFVGPAGFTDMSLVEYVRLSFPHSNVADSNALRFTADAGQQASISGFSSSAVRVFDVTDPSSPVEVLPSVAQDGASFSATVTVPGFGSRSLYAFASDQQLAPSAIVFNSPSTLATPANSADYVAITRKDLVSSVLPLVSQRKNQGLKSSLIDIEDVYDEFSFGNKSPQALKDLFSFAKSSWKKAPRFVSLVGDATFDPKNYLGLGDSDVVPTRLVETAFNETATDDWFVDVDNDGVPDIAIGRLPVRSSAEATEMVTKVINYDRSETIPRALLVADHNDAFDFEAAASDVKAMLPGTLDVTDIRRGQVGDSTARAMLIDSINKGAKIVNYYGHGSVQVWSNASLLTVADAATLLNFKRLALFDSMTCLTGFFHDVSNDSLGEALLKSPGGAIAVWASTGMTDANAQVTMNQQAIQLLFNNPGLTIGEVTAQAKAATTNPDVRSTWVLLGDPATKIK